MNAANILKTFTNSDTGMVAYVVANADGRRFNVVLQDLDSGEYVPVVNIYATQEAAEAKAEEVHVMSEKEVKAYLASIGSKGGKATGKSKVRGDKAYYQRISKKAAKARKRKADSAGAVQK